MAKGIITIQIGLSPFNNKANLYGNLTRDGWTVVKRGFLYGSATPPTIDKYDSIDADGEYYLTTASNLIAYTLYYYKAYADLKFWEVNEEWPEGHWLYETVNGDILFFYTNAIAKVKTIIAVNATKTGGSETIKFIGYLEDNADDKVTKRGFKYGLTEADTWDEFISGGSEGTYNITAWAEGDSYIYFRAYAITPTGTYYGAYEKASTKLANPVIFMLSQDLWNYLFYLIAYDQNGNIYNAWELTGEYWTPNCICADNDGNTYVIKDEKTIIKRTKDGTVAGTKAVVGNAYSIAFKPNGYIAVRSLIYGMQQLIEYRTNLNQGGGSVILDSPNPNAYTGLAVDNEGYTYVINRLTNMIEKWDWEQEWVLQEDEISISDVHIDTDILDLSINIETGAVITFWEDISLPAPLEEDIGYWAIRTSENHIKVAISKANALAGVAIDITSQGEGRIWIEEVSAKWKSEKIAERDLSGVYSGNSSYLAVAGNLIYSNEYGEQGWTIPTTLLEDPTNWTPQNDYVKSLSSLGGNKFILSGIVPTDKQGLSCYNISKELLWENPSYYEMDYYSITGIRSFGAGLINTKAERDSTQTSIRLYGEITEKNTDIAEKGFEYLIQDEEPALNATGIEVIKTKPEFQEFWDIGEYWAYEYEGNDVAFKDRLYNLEEDRIWWFRAICKDGGGNKFTAGAWMKNVPTMITSECTEVSAQRAIGNGEMTDKGANIVTQRGFRIIKEYVGDLFQAIPYIYDDFNCENLVSEGLYSPDGVLIGFLWKGDLYRDVLIDSNNPYTGWGLGIYENMLGGGMDGEGFGKYLAPNDIYKVIAMAKNQLGTGFGEGYFLNTTENILYKGSGAYEEMMDKLNEFDTEQMIEPSDDEIVGDKEAEKTITLGTLPYGCTVTRIGIRLGRTTGCSELHVYEDGSWTSGQSHTFFITGFVPGATYYKMPYIILKHIADDYEEEIKAIPDFRNPERLEEWLDDFPIEVFQDVEEDELDQTVTDSAVGEICYRTIIKEIKCERIGEQSFIDKWGRRKSHTIYNHLIQTHANCKIIIDDYLEKFQILKKKVVIDYDIPIPFEREDCILLGIGEHTFKEDGEGEVLFKEDGEGETSMVIYVLAKIRKIDSNYISGTETILSLELEV